MRSRLRARACRRRIGSCHWYTGELGCFVFMLWLRNLGNGLGVHAKPRAGIGRCYGTSISLAISVILTGFCLGTTFLSTASKTLFTGFLEALAALRGLWIVTLGTARL